MLTNYLTHEPSADPMHNGQERLPQLLVARRHPTTGLRLVEEALDVRASLPLLSSIDNRWLTDSAGQ